MRIKKLSIAVILFILFSCGEDKVEPSPDAINDSKIVQLVNDVRATGCKCGDVQMPAVEKLNWSNQLEKAAAKHSIDMNANNFFDNTGSDKSTPGDRIKNAGYIWTMYGENIGMGYTSEEEVINGWLTSGPHCKNLMNSAFTDFALSRSGDYWTMDLAKK
jgi:uncharacterized protein YkwD